MKEKIAPILKEQIKSAHENLEATMSDVNQKQAQWMPPGTANPIGATYAHLILSEDMIVSMLNGKKPLSSNSWKDKTGLSQPMPTPGSDAYREWTRKVNVDLTQAKELAKAIYKETEEYISTLKDEDFAKQVDFSGMGLGKIPLSHAIGTYVAAHADNITGEIAALKGVQGAKGYPW